MAKAKFKTERTKDNVTTFLNSVKDEQQRNDSFAIVEMMQRATGDKPKMWGTAIIGFGDVHLKYESGRELDWFKMGFSPRKKDLTLYGLDIMGTNATHLKKLGTHKTGKGCLYINKLDDFDSLVLKKIIETASK